MDALYKLIDSDFPLVENNTSSNGIVGILWYCPEISSLVINTDYADSTLVSKINEIALNINKFTGIINCLERFIRYLYLGDIQIYSTVSNINGGLLWT